MRLEMALDFSLGGIAREVAQVKASGRNLGHGDVWVGESPTGNLAWMGCERMSRVKSAPRRVQQPRPETRQNMKEEHQARDIAATGTRAWESPAGAYTDGWSYLGILSGGQEGVLEMAGRRNLELQDLKGRRYGWVQDALSRPRTRLRNGFAQMEMGSDDCSRR